MGRTKELLESEWYKNQGRIELHWMEQEYFNNLAEPNRKNISYDKLKNEEAISCQESERPYIQFAQENDRRSQRYRRVKGQGTK